MTDIVERVARALAAKRFINADGVTWERFGDEYLDLACTAISALRDAIAEREHTVREMDYQAYTLMLLDEALGKVWEDD
jgi:hypothetical protein